MLNDVLKKNQGFESDYNAVTLLSRVEKNSYRKKKKVTLAKELLNLSGHERKNSKKPFRQGTRPIDDLDEINLGILVQRLARGVNYLRPFSY